MWRSASSCPTSTPCSLAVGGGGLFSGDHAGTGRVTSGCPRGRGRARVLPDPAQRPRRRSPVDVQVGGVAADALGASRLGEIAFATASEHDTTSLLVDDDAIVAARRWLWREARIAAEPAGATALAALLTGATCRRTTNGSASWSAAATRTLRVSEHCFRSGDRRRLEDHRRRVVRDRPRGAGARPPRRARRRGRWPSTRGCAASRWPGWCGRAAPRGQPVTIASASSRP